MSLLRILKTNGFKWSVWKAVHLLHLNKLFYKLSPKRKILDVGEKAVEEARALLGGSCPDPKSSCIAKNTLAPEADIQVIVPVYNVEKYVCECLDSIVYAPKKYSTRITVVNDGSTDGSRELLKKYEGLPGVEIIDKQNGGLSDARNAGLATIVGRYVTFIDSDDFVEYAEIEKMFEEATEGGYDAVSASYDFVDDRSKHVSSTVFPGGDNGKEMLYGFAWGKLIKAEVFAGICFPDKYWFEDALMSSVAPCFCDRVYTHEPVMYHYRVRRGSISNLSRHNVKSIDSLYILEQLDRDRSELGFPRDQMYYNWVLQMIKYTAVRVQYLSKDIRRAIFVCLVDFMEKNFGDGYVAEKKFGPLVEAIAEHDFAKYSAYCRWL